MTPEEALATFHEEWHGTGCTGRCEAMRFAQAAPLVPTADLDRLRAVELAARAHLRGGEHEGPCDNDLNPHDACTIHLEASKARAKVLRAALGDRAAEDRAAEEGDRLRAALVEELYGLGASGETLVRIEEAVAAVYSRWSIETRHDAEEGCRGCSQAIDHAYHKRRGRTWEPPYHPFYGDRAAEEER